MSSRLPSGASDLTRRQALQAGGAGAAAAFVLLHLPAVAGASQAAQNHLLRSTWRDLSAPYLRAGPSILKLETVGDLSAAPNVPSLVNSQDAFSLVLSGPSGLGSGDAPLRVSNGELGTFDLFVSPLGGDKYEAVVNRVLSNRESRRTPPRPARRPGATGPAAAPKGGRRAGAATEPKRKRAIRKVRAARKRKGAKVVIQLAPSAGVDELTVWLKRDGKVVASATKRVREKKRAALIVKPRKRLRKGVYDIDVMATERDGEQSHRRARTRLR